MLLVGLSVFMATVVLFEHLWPNKIVEKNSTCFHKPKNGFNVSRSNLSFFFGQGARCSGSVVPLRR